MIINLIKLSRGNTMIEFTEYKDDRLEGILTFKERYDACDDNADFAYTEVDFCRMDVEDLKEMRKFVNQCIKRLEK